MPEHLAAPRGDAPKSDDGLENVRADLKEADAEKQALADGDEKSPGPQRT
jgi:hypothetical protein